MRAKWQAFCHDVASSDRLQKIDQWRKIHFSPQVIRHKQTGVGAGCIYERRWAREGRCSKARGSHDHGINANASLIGDAPMLATSAPRAISAWEPIANSTIDQDQGS
ncbi:hypothetical protein CBOM_07846 [Ceraceosorus bombacis]|uniref:Uncharacterized protein n=1 Tax=Ceraceosorus bombacis TaxID=401625 RepID=A0A0N7LB17_9BASI|nr:hypothetical protein CBOM_07846 [Ceraceosorus bombacis]